MGIKREQLASERLRTANGRGGTQNQRPAKTAKQRCTYGVFVDSTVCAEGRRGTAGTIPTHARRPDLHGGRGAVAVLSRVSVATDLSTWENGWFISSIPIEAWRFSRRRGRDFGFGGAAGAVSPFADAALKAAAKGVLSDTLFAALFAALSPLDRPALFFRSFFSRLFLTRSLVSFRNSGNVLPLCVIHVA